jgi:hypothetical protein
MYRNLATQLAQEIAIENQLSSFASNFVVALQGMNALYLENIISGQGNSPKDLEALLTDGKWLDNRFSDTNLYDMRVILSKVLYSQLLPRAWLWNPHIHPVIM